METVQPYTIHIVSDIPQELHWNTGLTTIFLLSGTLNLQVGADLFSLSEGDFLFFKPYELFSSLSPSQAYCAGIVTVEHDFLSLVCPSLDHIKFELQCLRANSEFPAYQSICNSFSRVIYHSLHKTPVSEARGIHYICDLVTTLVENFGVEYSSADLLPKVKSSQKRTLATLKFISEHYSDQISLKDISAEIGLHPQYFSIYFKKQFGVNFSEYLNNYRISKSLPALLSGQDTILDIAIASGFSNHKTYGAAFHKMFGCSPRDYRSQKQRESAAEVDPQEVYRIAFRFFQRFWETDTSTVESGAFPRRDIALFSSPKAQFSPTHNLKNIVTVGRATFCLRGDVQDLLRQAKKDLSLDYVRIQDIFSDDLCVYYEDEAKHSVFSWHALDTVFDFLLSVGVKPYPELGYMPAQMAAKKQYAGWQYHPNVSAPKSFSLWKTLVTQFFEHIVRRYGVHEVRSWLFDFWTLPNLRLSESYWYESKEKFFQFYEVTYRAMKSVDPQLQLCTPNFSYPSGLNWYQDFLTFCTQHNIEPAFLSARLYSYPDVPTEEKQKYLNYSPFGRNNSPSSLYPQKDHLYNAVQNLQTIIDRSDFPHLKIIISDWNITYFPEDYTRDTCFMGSYILNTYLQLLPHVAGISYTSLSDINEDFFSSDLLFRGGPGLVDRSGIPKASYHALSMVYALSKKILVRGENYVIAESHSGYEVILYNLSFYNQAYHSMDPASPTYTQRYALFEETSALNCHIALPLPSGSYQIVRYRVNRDNGSSYDLWLKTGAPKELSADLIQYLKAHSTPAIHCETLAAKDGLCFDEVVPPHGFVHILIAPQ